MPLLQRDRTSRLPLPGVTMRRHATIFTRAMAILAICLLAVGCKSKGDASAGHTVDAPSPAAVTSGSADVATSKPKPAAIPPTSPAVSAAGKAEQLPDLRGKGLQYAQDGAQAAGFYLLKSHDSLGRGRHQILDRDWKVCTQDPAAGRVDPAATIDFGSVKVAETCPGSAADTAQPTAAGAVMPNLVGKSLAIGDSILPNASITTIDGTGQNRSVFVPSNWQVCDTTPAAGAPYDGVPVTITVVKFGESCP